MERNKKIAIAVTAAVLVLTIVVYLLLNNPDDMKISGLNTGDGRTRQAQDAGDGRYETQMYNDYEDYEVVNYFANIRDAAENGYSPHYEFLARKITK